MHPGLSPPGDALVQTLLGHAGPVASVALTADGRRAVSSWWDSTLKVWDLETGSEVRGLAGHSDRVAGVAMGANGRRAVSASWDGSLKVWDLESGREVFTLAAHTGAHTGPVTGVALSG
jgi:WD40 repeat protein